MKIELEGHFGYRRLVVSALPGVLMMLVESIYSVVDGLFVSNFVGTTASPSTWATSPSRP